VGCPKFSPCCVVYPMWGPAMSKGDKGAMLVDGSDPKPCSAKVPLRFIEQGAIDVPTKAVRVLVGWQR